MKRTFFVRFVTFIIMSSLFTLQAFAQKEETIGLDSDGEFHIGSRIKAGGKTLKSGMYRIRQIYVNGEHFIVIRKVAMNRYGKSMAPMELGEEVARLKCAEDAGDKQNRNAKLLLHRNGLDERVAVEVWFRGERFRHILPK